MLNPYMPTRGKMILVERSCKVVESCITLDVSMSV